MWQDPNFYLCLFLGLCLGSFSTALAWRLPRDISILGKSRSACPACGHTLSFLDLVPVFSWVILRGRCRYCKSGIGWRYPLIEISTLALSLAFYMLVGWSWMLIFLLPLAAVMTSMIAIDLTHKIIPDVLNLFVFLLGLGLFLGAAFEGGRPFAFMVEHGPAAILGVVLYGGGSLLIRAVAERILKREPMGLGDIKFFAAAGFWWGTSPITVSAVLFLSGAIGVILALVWKRLYGEAEFPFGPSLVLTFILILFLQPAGYLLPGAGSL